MTIKKIYLILLLEGIKKKKTEDTVCKKTKMAAATSSQKSGKRHLRSLLILPQGTRKAAYPPSPFPSTTAKRSGERSSSQRSLSWLRKLTLQEKGILSSCRALEKDPCQTQPQVRKTPFPNNLGISHQFVLVCGLVKNSIKSCSLRGLISKK